jgi:hypothetical protein
MAKQKYLVTDSIIIANMFSDSIESRIWGQWKIRIKDDLDEAILITTCKDKCAWYRIEES